MPDRITSLREIFRKQFGADASVVVKGPGRVDLMGHHTDYNDGFVLPVAVDRDVIAAGKLRDDNKVAVYSANFDSLSEFDLSSIEYSKSFKWSNYVRGVLKCLQDKGIELRGMDIALHGNLPIGSGMSSSAALEMATAFIFQTLVGFEMSGPDMALVGQKAENSFVGVNTGIMDQFISRLGKKDAVLFLDCRSLEYETVPLDTSRVKIVVCDTTKRRGLVDSEYDLRRSQCEEGARLFAQWKQGVKALRDITPQDFQAHKNELPEVVRKRVEHVVYENQRVLDSRDILKTGDFVKFARLLDESHDSARDLYETSCAELDAMAQACRNAPGGLCSRLAGAGFGGCSVSLVLDEKVEEFVATASADYEKRTGLKPSLYVCTAEDGASIVG